MIRKTYDRALRSLPVTQHETVWGPYSQWALTIPCTKVAESILLRYGKIVPSVLPDLAEYLLQNHQPVKACKMYLQFLENDQDYSLYFKLCSILSDLNQNELDTDAIIRHGIKKYSDETGNLWNFLANYYQNQGMFE